ncbi:MAG: hypothetical protein COV75_03945 [Candidatus Omnitrophica bacterium CG11_big_fil_rev_8_21_14_0_20_63_9]|nr:MAG: hypothetical protein COV75_03945 [Candidatus Omnitrophica bacterium CG11_big_fil_rev_8_21_14_0_20_63_9]
MRLILSLTVLGIVSRLIPHPWNATPVMAIALFAGTYLPRRWAIVLPLAILAVTDVVLLWHNTVPFTWAAFALTGALGWWVRQRVTAGRIAAAGLMGSVSFFLISNFGVWLVGELYPRTLDGLWQCYVAAIPFFRGTFFGDLTFTAALFGGYALVTHFHAAQEPARFR